MAVPKRKTSPMKRGFRRSADALAAPTYVEDKESGELRRPHHIDLKSGKYGGRQVLKPKEEIYAGGSVIASLAKQSRSHRRRVAQPFLDARGATARRDDEIYIARVLP